LKAQTIYDITMSLMDERKNDGSVDTNSTKDYLARSPGILTVLQTEIIMELKKVGADVETLDEIKKMDADIDLEDDICLGIIPYGLAAQLLLQEDASLSNYFASKYDENRSQYLRRFRELAKQIDREDVYNSSMRAGD
jgi:hypothetical protein